MPETLSAAPAAAFLSGLGLTAAGAAATAFPTIFGIGQFLGGTALGNLLLNVGLSLVFQERPDTVTTDTESVRVNARIADGDRYQLMGEVAVGGNAAIFAEQDDNGEFWYIVAHGDAELIGDPEYLLDGIPVTLSDGTDGFFDRQVITDEFCLTDDYALYEGSGSQFPYYSIWTVSPSASSVYGTPPTAFTDAFPNLPADFLLAGVCYSIVKISTVPLEGRANVYRWSGPIGIGEPSVMLNGDFNRMYDPRNSAHDIDDSDTWTSSGSNPAIIWAWWRTHQFGRNRPMSEINWTEVAAAANICDETTTNRSGDSVPLYRCGVAAKDSTARQEVEKEILLTCDGFVAYDDEGKAYPVVGKYEAPTLTFTGARDIISSATEIVDDGETAVDGVVVRYISPDHGYTKQPCAPWQNPEYYVSGREPNYQFVDISGCRDHNQAFRLAGAIGARSAPPKKAALAAGVKGILAKSERAITLDLDAEFSGVFEIATPIEEDPNGLGTAFAVVPLASNRWLGAGQTEGEPPAPTPALNIDTTLVAPQNVSVTAEAVPSTTGTSYRFNVTFDAPARSDRLFRFRFYVSGTTNYEYFSADMDVQRAVSAIVDVGKTYVVQSQTVTGSGRATDWATEDTITISADGPPGALSSVTASTVPGLVRFQGNTPVFGDFKGIRIYRGATDDFSSATQIAETTGLELGSTFNVTAGEAATNMFANADFATTSDWEIQQQMLVDTWQISGGTATNTDTSNNGYIRQALTASSGDVLRYEVNVISGTASGQLRFYAWGGSDFTQVSESPSVTGVKSGDLTLSADATNIGWQGTSTADREIDDVFAFVETASHAQSGQAYFWVVPISNANVEGPESASFDLTIT
ncbi:MAG: hypothetical protein AAGK79_13365 [Pseudomonadota bacterium]